MHCLSTTTQYTLHIDTAIQNAIVEWLQRGVYGEREREREREREMTMRDHSYTYPESVLEYTIDYIFPSPMQEYIIYEYTHTHLSSSLRKENGVL